MILDFHFPDGLHRYDFDVARWRLQLLGEAGFGWRIRTQYAQEQGAVQSLKRSLGAPNGSR